MTKKHEKKDKYSILIVDDSPDVIDVLGDILRSTYKVMACTSGAKALQLIQGANKPDLILLDVMMEDMNGFQVCEAIKQNEDTRNISVIFITGKDDSESEVKGLQLGAVDYITKPFHPLLVETRIRNQFDLREYRDQLESRVKQGEVNLENEHNLLIKSDGLYKSLLGSIQDGVLLVNEQGEIELANSVIENLFGYTQAELLGNKIEMLIPERFHPHHPEFRTKFTSSPAAMRSYAYARERNERTPEGNDESITVLPGDLEARRKDGSEFFVTISLSPIEVAGVKKITTIVHDLTERKKWEDDLAKMAMTDPLTGLANRNQFDRKLQSTLQMMKRFGEAGFSLMLIDLDKFKPINDVYGHQAGDLVLRHVAHILTTQMREVDLVARLGGDEFAIICAGKLATKNIEQMSARILDSLAHPYFIKEDNVQVGASIGVYMVEDGNIEQEELVRKADLALYESKDKGRNCFTIYTEQDGADESRLKCG